MCNVCVFAICAMCVCVCVCACACVYARVQVLSCVQSPLQRCRLCPLPEWNCDPLEVRQEQEHLSRHWDLVQWLDNPPPPPPPPPPPDNSVPQHPLPQTIPHKFVYYTLFLFKQFAHCWYVFTDRAHGHCLIIITVIISGVQRVHSVVGLVPLFLRLREVVTEECRVVCLQPVQCSLVVVAGVLHHIVSIREEC